MKAFFKLRGENRIVLSLFEQLRKPKSLRTPKKQIRRHGRFLNSLRAASSSAELPKGTTTMPFQIESRVIDAVGRGVEAGEAVVCHVLCQKNWPVLLSELYGRIHKKRVFYDTIWPVGWPVAAVITQLYGPDTYWFSFEPPLFCGIQFLLRHQPIGRFWNNAHRTPDGVSQRYPQFRDILAQNVDDHLRIAVLAAISDESSRKAASTLISAMRTSRCRRHRRRVLRCSFVAHAMLMILRVLWSLRSFQ